MTAERVDVKNAAAQPAEQMVFVHSNTATLHDYAIQREGSGELVGYYGGKTLAELQRSMPDMVLMEEAAAIALQENKYRQPWLEITKDRYLDQLEVLPPLDLKGGPDGVSFKSIEMYCGNITNIFVEMKGRYFECRDVCTISHREVINSVASAFFGSGDVKKGH